MQVTGLYSQTSHITAQSCVSSGFEHYNLPHFIFSIVPILQGLLQVLIDFSTSLFTDFHM